MEIILHIYFTYSFFLSQCITEHFSFLCVILNIKDLFDWFDDTDAAASDPYDVDSDEEKDLLKGIKDEIKDMVS